MRQGKFEEEYFDVLQNLEFAIIQVARDHPDTTDWNVQFAVEALMRLYKAEAAGDQAPEPPSNLNPLTQEIYDAVHAMAEIRLGRGKLFNEDEEQVELPFQPITAQEMYQCLKRIRKSIQRWTKRRGRKGYLTYIDQFLPKTPEE